MLNHKKLSLLIAAGLAVSLSVFPVFAADAPAAGDPPPANRESRPRMNMFDRLATELKLTDDQKTTVDPILKNAQTQTDAIRADKDVSREDKRAQTLAIVEGLPDKLNPTLDKDQQATLAAFVDRMKNPPARGEGRGRGGDGAGRGGEGGGRGNGARGPRGNRPQPNQGGDQPAPGQDG